jgi:iron complex transport system ATP-binding protein
MIALDGVALAYGTRTILAGVTLALGAGEVVALVGANGAGKSTLLRAIAGTGPVAAGTIAFDGRSIATLDARERGRTVALIEAEGPIPDGVSVADVVAAGRLPYRPWWRWSSSAADHAAVDAAIARLELEALRERPFAQLSSGERQRVWIAMAVAQAAPTLLLDEPTSHLDIRHTFEALTLIRRLTRDGTSSIVVLHDLNVAAAFADRIALLGEGTLLACDTPQAIFDEALLARAYGIPIAVRRDPDGTLVAFAVPPER